MSDEQQVAPGWYPAADGTQRWWDGAQWTEYTAPVAGAAAQPMVGGAMTATVSDSDTTLALITHLLSFVSGFIGPLVVYLAKKDESAFIRHHAAEALNFQLTLLVAFFVSFIALFILVGFLLLPIVGILGLIFPILAAIGAGRGEWYRYPLTIRFVN